MSNKEGEERVVVAASCENNDVIANDPHEVCGLVVSSVSEWSYDIFGGSECDNGAPTRASNGERTLLNLKSQYMTLAFDSMKLFNDKFCYLRCLDATDQVCFVDAMVDAMMRAYTDNNNHHNTIVTLIRSGRIRMSFWSQIMTTIGSNLSRTYELYALCTELGYPLRDHPSTRSSLINYGVLLKTFGQGLSIHYIVYSRQHLFPIFALRLIPTEPCANLSDYVHWDEVVNG